MSDAIATLNEKLNSFKGQKTTMLIQNTVGVIVLRHVTISDSSKVVAASQFSTQPQINLYYAIKGKRKSVGTAIDKDCKLALCLGWQAIEGMEEHQKGQFGYNDYFTFNDDQYSESLSKLIGAVVLQ